MNTGHDFLRAQVNNCIMQHKTLIHTIRDHEKQADDPVFRDLCTQYLPTLEHHQVLIEAYGNTIGTPPGGSTVKNAIGAALGWTRDAVDALRQTDFLRVVGDIVMIRQSQDTFRVFAAAGDQIGDHKLAALGHACAEDHDAMQQDFNAYVTTLFVAHVEGTDVEQVAVGAVDVPAHA